MANRFLRSERLRGLLFLAWGGKCAICGEDLGEDWEADHRDPWCVTQRTNIHELQPTHRSCNRKKGAESGV